MSVQLKHFSDALEEPFASSIYRQKVCLTPAELKQVEKFIHDKTTSEGNRVELQNIRKHFSPNDMIYNRGDVPAAIYFIVSGKVLSYIEKVENYKLALDVSANNGFFGEVATIGYRYAPQQNEVSNEASCIVSNPNSMTNSMIKLKRTASERALTDTVLLKLPESFLDEFIEKHPALFRKITSGMVERLHRSANDLHDARVKNDELQLQQAEASKKSVHASWVNWIGSYSFLGFCAVVVAFWCLMYAQYGWDRGIQWFPLSLAIIQIVIGTLVLKSQLHVADRSAKLQEHEREANITAEREIHTVALELRSQLPKLLADTQQIKEHLAYSHKPSYTTTEAANIQNQIK